MWYYITVIWVESRGGSVGCNHQNHLFVELPWLLHSAQLGYGLTNNARLKLLMHCGMCLSLVDTLWDDKSHASINEIKFISLSQRLNSGSDVSIWLIGVRTEAWTVSDLVGSQCCTAGLSCLSLSVIQSQWSFLALTDCIIVKLCSLNFSDLHCVTKCHLLFMEVINLSSC